MLGLHLDASRPLRLLVTGAHADDIEIGCGASLVRLLREHPSCHVDWLVATACGERAAEARASADAYLSHVSSSRVHIWDFRDGFLPYEGGRLKDRFEEFKTGIAPDLVLTHYRDDRHQDHRLVSDFVWNTFRDAIVLEYEIPKWDGDLGQPNLYVDVQEQDAREKVERLNTHYASQRSRDWWDDETFFSMMRMRGIECRSASRFAEAFYARKVLLNLAANGKVAP